MRRLLLIALLLPCLAASVDAGDAGDDHFLHAFQRQQLTDVYYSEGANAGDFNGDGQADVVHGPYWFAGPEFKAQHEIYPPVAQNRDRYADNFFSWPYDFNQDGYDDVLVGGFPGTPAFVYENPGPDGLKDGRHWEKHQVLSQVSNESPQFVDLVGDERPELICTLDRRYGYAMVNWERPFEPWTFHPVSEPMAPKPFGHGLGVGDVDGDGRQDILFKDGWLQHPQSSADGSAWKVHPAPFAPRGGADMYAYDVDGDGDNDVITSLAAHEFGLAWYEQRRRGDAISFQQHLIMGDQPRDNRYGLVFSELHSVQLADIDGDGLKDIVTGKTYWSHHRQSPMWDAGAVVYWFRLTRGEDGVDFVPYQADGEAGIGRQVIVHDLNGDQLPDFVVGGMKGAHVLIHRRERVDAESWQKAQPKPFVPPPETPKAKGPAAPIEPDSGKVPGALEGEALSVQAAAGSTSTQIMTSFAASRWSGNAQLYWRNAKPGDKLVVELPVESDGQYTLETVLTRARDYGVVQLTLDDKPLCEPIDLYERRVTTTGVLSFGPQQLSAGTHQLGVKIVGANPAAVQAYMFGLDYVRLKPQR